DLAVSSNTVRDLAFADVDGDGTTDVLGLSHESLRWSSGGRSSWVTLRHHHGDLSTIQLGDFDGDGAVELLTGGCL
ncbi:MAG TPA: VCBS repeat-containing protein, partial [Myxococcota bacterium]|nr:VCBS repeat-containing protein [Myxococcota bacterium]